MFVFQSRDFSHFETELYMALTLQPLWRRSYDLSWRAAGSVRHASGGHGFDWVKSLVNHEKDGLPDEEHGWDLVRSMWTQCAILKRA